MAARLTRVVAVPVPAGITGVLTLLVPLTADGRLDAAQLAPLADVATAMLERAPAGRWPAPIRLEDEGWTIQPTRMEDAPPWRLAAGAIRPGAYLTLCAPDAEPASYRIVNVEALDRTTRDDDSLS